MKLDILDGGNISRSEAGAFLTLKEFPLTFLVKSPVASVSIFVPIELPQQTGDEASAFNGYDFPVFESRFHKMRPITDRFTYKRYYTLCKLQLET